MFWKRMSFFWKKTKYLTLASIISIVVIITYKITENMPEWRPGADYIYNLFSQLSFSYLASYIFYIVQVYIPERRKTMHVNRHISKNLEIAFKRIINIFEEAIDIGIKTDKNIYELSDCQIEKLCKLIKLEDEAPLADIKLNKYKYIDFIRHEINEIQECLNKVLKYGYCLDVELVILIESIANSQFHEFYIMFHESSKKAKLENEDISVFYSSIIEYIKRVNATINYCEGNFIELNII